MPAVIVDGEETRSDSVDAIVHLVLSLDLAAHREVWVEYGGEDEARMMALVSGDVGWLMFLRWVGDAGYSSRCPGFSGEGTDELEFVLANGQRDRYPMSWCYPLNALRAALVDVLTTGALPERIAWWDDAQQMHTSTDGARGDGGRH